MVLPAARREGALAVLLQLGEGSRLLSLEVLRTRADAKSLQLCLTAIPWTVAHQASLSVGFCRQEYWSGLPSLPGDLPNPGIEAVSIMSPALAGGSLPVAPPGKSQSEAVSA